MPLISIRDNAKRDSPIGFHGLSITSFNCRNRLRHALLLLFGLILDNKWIGNLCDSLGGAEGKGETARARR